MKGGKRWLSLLLSALVLAAAAAVTLAGERTVRAEDYQLKLRAAGYMEDCMEAVRAYRREAGLAINPEDWHQTGMIGVSWSPITTTSGALEAKRTCANPDMAALAVELLEEAGVKAGDRVAAGFSGSFPGMNLAVLSACRAMDVEAVYITSVGSSTYGANEPELTFPDMAQRLAGEGLIDRPPEMNSLGGDMDCGLDMDAAVREEMLRRLESYAAPVLYEENFEANVLRRMECYEAGGAVDCFVGVGGNMTTSGRNGTDLGWGLVDPGQIPGINEGSGLVERYAARGVPVIHLLNIKRLTADYGLPYDPEVLPAMGASAIYYQRQVPLLPGSLGVAGAVALLWWGGRRGEKR